MNHSGPELRLQGEIRENTVTEFISGINVPCGIQAIALQII